MPHFYINSNSLQDDSDATWNSSVISYLDTEEYLAGGLAGDSDVVWYASDHVESYLASTTLTYQDKSTLVSINKTTNLYEAGAEVGVSGGTYNLTIANSNPDGGIAWFSGIKFISGNDIWTAGNVGVEHNFYHCHLKLGTNANDTLYISGLSYTYLYNSTIEFQNTGNRVYINGASILYIENLSIIAPASTLVIFYLGNGGGILKLSDSDLSNITLTQALIRPFSAGDTNDIISAELTRIKTGSYDLFYKDSVRSLTFFDAYSCGIDTNYYTIEAQRREGGVKDSIAITRTNGATYDLVNPFSLEFLTNGNYIKAYLKPLKLKIGDYKLDLSVPRTLTFYLMLQDTTTPIVLNNDECWVDIEYPDATDYTLGKVISTKPADITTIPTALGLSSETWSGTSGEVVQMKIEVTVPASFTGAPVTAYLNLAKDITSIGTTEFFVCPKPGVV